MIAKRHFGLIHYPFPKAAQAKNFFDKSPGYTRLARSFQHLVEEPGLATLCADAGLGKTAAMRHLCSKLPQPDYQIIYLCDTTIAPVDLYRALAIELGVRPSHRRSQVWADLKKALLHLVDERGTHPIVVIDEAQHLSDAFLMDLSGFLNFAFDSRDLFTLWLVGLPAIGRRLHQLQHAALLTRVASEVRLEPLDRETFLAALEHAFTAAGATTKLYSDQAAEMLFRSSRGVLRVAARLVRSALRLAQERAQNFIDEPIVQLALDELGGAT
jgi:type II secretory pathway predicted ATPase ExeA